MSLFRYFVSLGASLSLVLCSVSAWAGFAQLAPPGGFARTGGANFYGGSAAANAPFVNGSAAAAVTTQVGGKAVTFAAPMTLAANAAQFAVSAVRLTPTSLAVGAVATWLATYGLDWATDQWRKTETQSVYAWSAPNYNSMTRPTAPELCAALIGAFGGTNTQCSTTGSTWNFGQFCVSGGPAPGCYAMWRETVSQGSVQRPANEGDWAPVIAAPLPNAVAEQLRPTVPLPVIAPWEAPNPLPATIRAPTASPYPVPGTNPQEYRQPVIDVKPMPTPDIPFRVDLAPGDVPVPTPTGLTEPTPLAGGEPVAAPPTKVELETCGLPNTPKCMIDETGTPSGNADDKMAGRLPLDAAFEELKGKTEGPTKPTDLGWSFTSGVFGFPAASCQPFTWGSRVGSLSVDVCSNSLVNTVRGMLAWLMYGITLLYVWRRVNEAPQGAKT